MEFIFYVYTILFFISLAFFYFLAYNIFIGLIYIELASLSVSILLVTSSLIYDERYFEFFSVVLMTTAGAESAIAIALFVAANKISILLTAEEFSSIKL